MNIEERNNLANIIYKKNDGKDKVDRFEILKGKKRMCI